jgi:hypothetical protein
MQQQMSKDEMQKKMEQIKLNNKEIEKQLDQNLEIFKKMEIERKFSDIVSQLEELKQKQEELRSQLSDNQNITEEQKKKQDSINKAFDEIKKDLEQAKKENQNLENPIRINTAEDKQQQAEKSLEQAMQQMQNGNSKQAKSSQKEAEDAMEEMAEALQNSMSESEKEENKEDAEMIKRLLKNIVIVSKQQENIEEEMKNITVNNKRYPVLLKEQQSLNKNIRHISDSLYALGKRQAAVANVINQELKNMEHYSNDVMSDLLAMNTVFVSGYKNNSAIRNQQLLMTSLNNVAVLLAESLDKMDKQNMSGSGKGSKSGKKKSGGENSTGKSSAQSARELQEQLNKQLEQMKQQMGKQEGGQKGQASMSEQLARSAAQQEAVRKMMQDAMNEMKAQGLKPSNDMQKILDDMEKTEKELVNKIVNQNTLKRQQDILTRLLEHEKAELKREQEERRQSQEAKQQNFKVPEEVIKKQQNSQQEIENIRKIQPVLRPFYKQEVQRYFEN